MSFLRACELLSSTEKQDNNEVIKIIEEESLHNAADTENNTLLHHAAVNGNHEVAQYLIDAGSIVHARNHLGQTPLVSTLLTDFPCKQVIEILLKTNASIFIKDKSGKNALEIVDSAEWLGVNNHRFEIYKIFLENARHLNDFKVPADASEQIIKMLLQTNVDLYAIDSNGATLVHMLAKNSKPGIMALLRGKRCNFNAPDGDAWTPLMYAALNGAAEAAEILLSEGADIEAVDDEGRTALYIACEYVIGPNVDCIQVLLEHRANAQITIDDELIPTIFDLFLTYNNFIAGELVLAHLALQEANGIVINQSIRKKIESYYDFETYFQYCKRQLSINIYCSIKLFDILAASERRLEIYLRNKELASQLEAFKTVDYFNTILCKRFSKAISMIELRKSAALIIGKLMQTDYDRYPMIADGIASYLKQKDMESLISIKYESLC